MEIALRDHPELRRGFETDALPEQLTDDTGNVWNPRVHLTLHATTERQIANDEPHAEELRKRNYTPPHQCGRCNQEFYISHRCPKLSPSS